MASHCSPASHTQPNNSQEYHKGLKGWRKAVVLGDCLILFPPVPPPLPPILFHSWPYRQSDTSMASRVPGRFGLESQVSSAYGSLEGAVGSPGEHISRLGGWEMLFPVSGKTALSGCPLPASFSPQGCSFSSNFPGTSRALSGPSVGTSGISVAHTHRSMIEQREKERSLSPSSCY